MAPVVRPVSSAASSRWLATARTWRYPRRTTISPARSCGRPSAAGHSTSGSDIAVVRVRRWAGHRGSSPSTGAAFGSPPGHARSSVSFPSWLRAYRRGCRPIGRSESRARSSPRFIEWCVTGRLGEVGNKAVLTRDDEARVFWPLLDPPDLGHELAARLTVADELLARWMVGDLPDETGVEEMQTAIEIVLRGLLGEVSGCLFRSWRNAPLSRQSSTMFGGCSST